MSQILPLPFKVQRDSNLELYRIIAMMLIVAHHSVVNSGLTSEGSPLWSDPLSWRSLFLLEFGAWGKTGINCFMLITGYFMCKSTISIQKFVRLMSQIYFYRIVFYIILALVGYQSITAVSAVKLLFPIWGINQNFVSCFIVFWLCIPFLNKFVHSLDEKQHRWLLILLLTIYSLLGSIPTFNVSFNYVTWFSILYFISSYIRLYPRDIYSNTKFWGWSTAISLTLGLLSVVFMQALSTYFGKTGYAFFFVADSNKILVLAVGFTSFMYFKNIKIKYNKFINAVAASTFGVLLIHANSDAMRTWLWKDFIDCVGHYDAALMPLYFIGCTIAIFGVCSLIDHLRIRFIEKPFMKWWTSFEEKRNLTKIFS